MKEAQKTLCRYCVKLFPLEDREHSTRPFHPNVTAFLQQISSYSLCIFIRSQLELDDIAKSNSSTDAQPALLQVRLKELHCTPHGVRWAFLEVLVQSHTRKVYTFSITTCEKSSSNNHYSAWISPSKSVEGKTSVINTWLQLCESRHGLKCKPTKGRLPKRLINVNLSGGSCRIVRVDDPASVRGRYATLSHCWGAKLPLRLLKSNLHLYSQHIPLSVIPETFRNAIAIAQKLQIPYLWIDALCIIQDSVEDWEEEALKMKDVYSGSWLNIAASDASGSEEGCFPDPNFGENNNACQFSVEGAGNNVDLAVKVHIGDTRKVTNDRVLNTRGWVLQEQVLSHRLVHCMRSELHWECMEMYETEAGVQFQQTTSDARGVPRLNRSALALNKDGVWRSWMHDYSKRNFTFLKDRLPALSGIVQHYQKTTGDIPLLGLWRSSLVHDLLWVRLGRLSPEFSKDARPMGLPSWSWLSCHAEIDFDIWRSTSRTNNREDPLVVVKDHCRVLDCVVTWNDDPFMSPVKEARIVLEGPTLQVLVRVRKKNQLSNPPYLDVQISHVEFSSDLVSECAGQFDVEKDVEYAKLTGFLLRSREHIQTGVRREIFLLLEHIAGTPEEYLYRRVGIACFIRNKSAFSVPVHRKVVLL